MKQRFENKQRQVILAGALLIAGGAAALLGFSKIAFVIGRVNVAVYPAAGLALLGVVLAFRLVAAQQNQS